MGIGWEFVACRPLSKCMTIDGDDEWEASGHGPWSANFKVVQRGGMAVLEIEFKGRDRGIRAPSEAGRNAGSLANRLVSSDS